MVTRRHFLLGTAAVTGTAATLVVGWSVLPPRQRLVPSQPLPVSAGEVALNGWVKVSADDTVTVMMSQAEMGQGTHTGVAMLLADEMDAAWERIRLEQSTIDGIYSNQAIIGDALPLQPDDDSVTARSLKWLGMKIIREVPAAMGTGGSSSIKDQWLPLREAGATARVMLIAAAAEHWGVSADTCQTEAGRVLHPSGKSASFGELAARAAQLPPPKQVTLKQPAQFKLIGQPVRRLDSAAKQNGSAAFAIDALPSGLLHARVIMCPTLGGKVRRFDATKAQALRGVRKVVALEPVAAGLAGMGSSAGGVAVIADTPFQAMRAVEQIEVDWEHGPAAGVSSRAILDGLSRTLETETGTAHLTRGDIAASLKSAASTIDAEYRVPFLAHAAMEPLTCTVQFKDGAATVWASTQAPAAARSAVATALGIADERVKLIVPFLGGGFGRRYFNDVLVQAATLARAADGAPVQLVWSREQDMTHDFYRPAVVSRHRAGFDARGNLVAWQATAAGPSMGAPSFLQGGNLKGAFDTGYGFPNARVAYQASDSPIPVGIWRSVAHSQNAFFTESFMDEAAAAAKQDPVIFRAALLGTNPRMLAVLKRTAELAGWGRPSKPAPDGAVTARGIALHRCFGSVVCQVAEVSLASDRQIRVHRVVCGLDCGFAVNPNLVRQQVEGGIIYGLSAALHGEITIENGQVQQSNFDGYAPLRFDECPEIVTEIMPGGETPEGVGEVGVPAIAPAVANAVFALTGTRLRSLPLVLA